MRTEANRRKINRLYILGAGASYALTQGQQESHVAPLDIQFCGRIRDLQNCRRPAWVADAANRVESEYLHHIDFQIAGLEELIRQQISDYEFIASIHPRRSRGKRTKEEYLNDLIHLVAYVLSRSRASDQTLLEKWLEKYIKGTEKRGTNNRIITFNYDTLVDDVILKWHSPQHVYFDNIWSSSTKPPKRLTDRHPLLIKLHGSINWRCPETEYAKLFNSGAANSESKTTTYNTKGCHYIDKMWIDHRICRPQDDETPLIIPPLPQKPITSIAIFRYLWTYAYEYLYEARNIVVAGYSLPPADTLAVSLFSKFKNTTINNLTIVDPNEEVLGKWIKLFRRNGIKSHEVHYHPDFFEYIEKET